MRERTYAASTDGSIVLAFPAPLRRKFLRMTQRGMPPPPSPLTECSAPSVVVAAAIVSGFGCIAMLGWEAIDVRLPAAADLSRLAQFGGFLDECGSKRC